MRYLVIDDHPGFIELVYEYLHKLDHEFEFLSAGDGREGLELFDAHMPDLVVLDMTLPDQDCCTLARIFREKNPHVGILIASAHRAVTHRDLALEFGADEFIHKMNISDELIPAIEGIIAKRKSGWSRTELD